MINLFAIDEKDFRIDLLSAQTKIYLICVFAGS
jgi:hypothetical protein